MVGRDGPYQYCAPACYRNKKRKTRTQASVGYNEVFLNPASPYATSHIDARLSLRVRGGDDEFYNPKSPFAYHYNPKSPFSQHWNEERWYRADSAFANRWRVRYDDTVDIQQVLDALLGKIQGSYLEDANDVRQELALGLLTLKLPIAATREEILRYRARARGTNWFQHLSIAALTRAGDAQTWGQRLGLS